MSVQLSTVCTVQHSQVLIFLNDTITEQSSTAHTHVHITYQCYINVDIDIHVDSQLPVMLSTLRERGYQYFSTSVCIEVILHMYTMVISMEKKRRRRGKKGSWSQKKTQQQQQQKTGAQKEKNLCFICLLFSTECWFKKCTSAQILTWFFNNKNLQWAERG